MKARSWRVCWAASFVCVFMAGCASHPAMLVPRESASQTKLGRVQGTARGSQLLGLIPIRSNSRTRRAYAAALEQAPGATALTEVTLQENWYWYYLGTIRVVTVTGEAVK